MAEWSIAAVLKTVELRGSGGSNPSLSANKGVNQQVVRFTPFITPKIIEQPKVTPKAMNLGCNFCIGEFIRFYNYVRSHQNLPEVLLAKQDGIVVTSYSGNN